MVKGICGAARARVATFLSAPLEAIVRAANSGANMRVAVAIAPNRSHYGTRAKMDSRSSRVGGTKSSGPLFFSFRVYRLRFRKTKQST